MTMDKCEESQDVDIAILSDDEQPKSITDGGETLPHFQFFDGQGAAHNSTDRPIEGFVALKITYEHVFRKQREKTRLLQQKNQQLVAELKQLRKESKSSRCHLMVEQSISDDDVATHSAGASQSHAATQLINKNIDMNDDSLQLAVCEADKAKLKSGLLKLAGCLLKRESRNSTFSELLKKIVYKLQSPQGDSDESLMKLCSLVEEMCDHEDLVQWQNAPEPSQKQLTSVSNSSDANPSANVSPMDASLQTLLNYQSVGLIKCQNSEFEIDNHQIKGSRVQSSFAKGKMEKEKYEEDMYGPEETLSKKDCAQYNIARLFMKLKKMQQFPAKYESRMHHINFCCLGVDEQRLPCHSSNAMSS